MTKTLAVAKSLIVVEMTLFLGTFLFVSPVLAQYKEVNLVADLVGHAPNVDPLLIDPWGLVLDHGQFVVADPGANEIPGGGGGGAATFYRGRGQIGRSPVTVPPAPVLGNIPGSPTGVVVNPSKEFIVSKGGKSAPAELIFDTLDGTISAWSPEVDPDNAIIVIDNSTRTPNPASYTGLAIARGNDGHYTLYAADSGISPTQSNNEIAVFNGNFDQIGHFGDPDAPSNMTVFGVQEIQKQLYVTYAAFAFLQGGVVAVFDLQGNLLKEFTANGPEGPLEEPWAVVSAPKSFGQNGGQILIGNVSDGKVNGFDPGSGKFVASLQSSSADEIALPGLWGLLFAENRLYFTEGPSFPPNTGVFADGVFGMITLDRGAK